MPIFDDIEGLLGYLRLGHKSLSDNKISLENKLNENIKKLKEEGHIPPDISTNDVFKRVQESELAMILGDSTTNIASNHLILQISSFQEGLADAEEYENMFYASVLVMVYSYIEQRLVNLCRIQKASEYHEHGVINQARIFLEKSNHEVDNAMWKELKFIRWLRNTIVHSGLSLELDDSFGDMIFDSWGEDALVRVNPDLKKYLIKHQIYIKEYGYISLNLVYCEYVIKFAREFFIKAGFDL